MLDFLKKGKFIIAIVAVIIGFIIWKVYNKSENFSSEDFLASEKNTVSMNITEEEEDIIVIHIIGEVKKPGVVRVKEGSRVEDIVKEAGGLTENADISNINLAYIVEDGTKIRIPSIDEENNDGSYISADGGKGVIISEENDNTSSSIVNINTASETELEQLPGIGPSISSKIVEYRNQKGKFKSIEDIKNVTGIGDNKFEKIKDLIRVK